MNRFTRLGVRAYGKSEGSLWVVALAAYYSDNYTEFGRLVKRDKSTVSRWAAGYITYKQLVLHSATVRQLRKQLTLKHFWTLGMLWKRYEFPPDKALEYLELASEGWTPERMAVEITETEEPGCLFKDWRKFSDGLREWGERLQNGGVPYDIPDYLKDRAVFLGSELELLAVDVDKERARHET